jgi:hypothetical protein
VVRGHGAFHRGEFVRSPGIFTWLLLFAVFTVAATLEWDRNPETNVIGYRVFTGSVSRAYGPPMDVGNVTKVAVLTGIGTTYFAVTAYDSDGLESDYSEEVFYTLPNELKLTLWAKVSPNGPQKFYRLFESTNVCGPWMESVQLNISR